MGAFGDELRRLRKRAGMSQELLADRAGLSPEAVSLLERGRRSPRMTTMRLLADALELDPSTRQRLFDAQVSEDPRPAAPARSSPAASNGLVLSAPRYLDVLVGRDDDMERLTALLANGTRLLSITGPGGVGKTRVAAELVGRVHPWFRDGVGWMSMASVGPGNVLLPAAAAALGARLEPGGPIGSLVEQLADHHQLIVFDGSEHLLEEVRDLALHLVTGSPGLTVLITSSHRLLLAGETAYVLDPLSIPAPDAGPDELADSPAARLFLDRAGSTRSLSGEEAVSVSRICRRLDGLPLALEMAAARSHVLSLPALADALDRTLGILRPAYPAGADELTERVVGWTYRLLSADEQLALQRMTAFTSFTHASLAAVCADRWDAVEVLDLISSLLAKSLLSRFTETGETARFTLFEVVRAFAGDRLTAVERATVRRRHAEYFSGLVLEAEPRLTSGEQHAWLGVLDEDVSNLRLALAWFTEHDPHTGLRTAGALWRWCYLRGRYTEGRRWMTAALQAAGDAPAELRASALAGSGILAFLQCDYAQAQSQIELALHTYREIDDPMRIGWCLTRLGSIARERGEYERAEQLHTQALQLAESFGDSHAVGVELNYLAFVAWIRGDLDAAEQLGPQALRRIQRSGDDEALVWALVNVGVTARYRDDLRSAELLLQQALDLSRRVGFREGVAWAENQLGVVARLNGQHTTARLLQQSSLEGHDRVGDRWRMASVLDELAAIAVATGDYRTAAAELGVADRLRDDIGTPVPAAERADRERVVRATQEALGTSFRAALLAGSLRRIVSGEAPTQLRA